MFKKYIKVKTRFDGVHYWPECTYEEVSYLKHPHRHTILVDVTISTDKSREVEFFMFKDELNRIINEEFPNVIEGTTVRNLSDNSMESIAMLIITHLKRLELYKDRSIKVEVSEDGDGTGIVEDSKTI